MNEKIKLVVVTESQPIRRAIKQLNENSLQILFAVDAENKLIGTITDGDIRRAILNNLSLDEPVSQIMNRNPKYVYRNEDDKAYEIMVRFKVRTIPVLDVEQKVIDLITVDNLNLLRPKKRKPVIKSNAVFIMAGGKGTRLDPFTKILPKPLIPIGEKPIIEVIMSNFKKYGLNNFIISLNYKAEVIKLYFAENPDGYNISYTMEQEALGTAGALALAKERLQETFIVSNCDVIIDINFEDLLTYHKKQKNDATIVGVVKNMQIPYGVLKVEDGALIQMTEKPEYDFMINSGIYVLEPGLIDMITEKQPMNMPDLLVKAKDTGYKVGVFPITSNWFDIGQWEEYQKTLDYFKKAENECS